jgi:hypothetical protein
MWLLILDNHSSHKIPLSMNDEKCFHKNEQK